MLPQPSSTTASAAIALDLIDGSWLRGETSLGLITLRDAAASSVRVGANRVDWIEFSQSGDHDRMALMNGARFTGRVDLEEIELLSALGRHVFAREAVMALERDSDDLDAPQWDAFTLFAEEEDNETSGEAVEPLYVSAILRDGSRVVGEPLGRDFLFLPDRGATTMTAVATTTLSLEDADAIQWLDSGEGVIVEGGPGGATTGALVQESFPLETSFGRIDLAASAFTRLDIHFCGRDVVKGLVVWLRFPNVDDHSGHGLRAELSGTEMCKGLGGEDKCALLFDGVNDFARLPADERLDLRESLTLIVWARNDGDDDGQIIWRGDAQGARDPYQIHITNKHMEFRIDEDATSYAVRSQQPVDNEWHMWAGVCLREDGRIRLYKDGKLESGSVLGDKVNYNTAPMRTLIGAVDTGNWQLFKGKIDEVRIYDRALSAEEIGQIHSRGPRR